MRASTTTLVSCKSLMIQEVNLNGFKIDCQSMRQAKSSHGSLETSTQEVHTVIQNGQEDTILLSIDSNQQLECNFLVPIITTISNFNGQNQELKIHLEQPSKVEKHQLLDKILNSKSLKLIIPSLCLER